MQQARLTTTQLNRHEPFAHHTSEVGPGNQLLTNITTFGEADGIQTIQVIF